MKPGFIQLPLFGTDIQPIARCARCHRRLTVPDSVQAKIGPTCRAYLAAQEEDLRDTRNKELGSETLESIARMNAAAVAEEKNKTLRFSYQCLHAYTEGIAKR